jgi:hypothetical protein
MMHVAFGAPTVIGRRLRHVRYLNSGAKADIPGLRFWANNDHFAPHETQDVFSVRLP